MKKVFILLCVMLSAMLNFAQEAKRVAILETVDKEGNVSYANKLILRANLAKAVTKTPGYEAYDRTDMDAIMGEQDFQRTGMVSDDQIKRLGEMTGAKYVLVAEAVYVDENTMFITAKLLDVETARTEMTDNQMMGISANDIQRGCEVLATNLFRPEGAKPIILDLPKTSKQSKHEAPVIANEKPAPVVKEKVKKIKNVKDDKPVEVKHEKTVVAKQEKSVVASRQNVQSNRPLLLGVNMGIGIPVEFGGYRNVSGAGLDFQFVGFDFAYPITDKFAMGFYTGIGLGFTAGGESYYNNQSYYYQHYSGIFFKFSTGLLMEIGELKERPFLLGISPCIGFVLSNTSNALPMEFRFGRVLSNNWFVTGELTFGIPLYGATYMEFGVRAGYNFGHKINAKKK